MGLILIDGEVPLDCPPLRRAIITQERNKSSREKIITIAGRKYICLLYHLLKCDVSMVRVFVTSPQSSGSLQASEVSIQL